MTVSSASRLREIFSQFLAPRREQRRYVLGEIEIVADDNCNRRHQDVLGISRRGKRRQSALDVSAGAQTKRATSSVCLPIWTGMGGLNTRSISPNTAEGTGAKTR